MEYCVPQCGAVSFVENVRAKNLMIEEEEFNVKMGFVDGKTDIDLYLAEGEVEEEEDRERIMVLEVGTIWGIYLMFLIPEHLPISQLFVCVCVKCAGSS
jgi:hypothetical protein